MSGKVGASVPLAAAAVLVCVACSAPPHPACAVRVMMDRRMHAPVEFESPYVVDLRPDPDTGSPAAARLLIEGDGRPGDTRLEQAIVGGDGWLSIRQPLRGSFSVFLGQPGTYTFRLRNLREHCEHQFTIEARGAGG